MNLDPTFLTPDVEAFVGEIYELGVAAVVGLESEPAATLLIFAAADLVLAARDCPGALDLTSTAETILMALKIPPVAWGKIRDAMEGMIKTPAEVSSTLAALSPALSTAITRHHQQTGADLYLLYLAAAAYLVEDAAHGLERPAASAGLTPQALAAGMLVSRLLA